MRNLNINTTAKTASITRLTLTGSFNSMDAIESKADLFDAVQEAEAELWIDLKAASELDISAFNTLIQTYRRAQKSGKVISLTPPADNSLAHMLNMSKLNHCFVTRTA